MVSIETIVQRDVLTQGQVFEAGFGLTLSCPKKGVQSHMLSRLRRWHGILLHEILGLPDRDHTKPYPRSHPVVPAHHRRTNPEFAQSLQMQFERELQRQPRVLKGWQLQIRQVIKRPNANRTAQNEPRSEF